MYGRNNRVMCRKKNYLLILSLTSIYLYKKQHNTIFENYDILVTA